MKKYFQKGWNYLWKGLLLFFVSTTLVTIIYRFVPIPLTPLMVIRLVEQGFNGEPLKLKKDWVSYEEISHHMPLAVVASEDQLFLDHYGFDLKAIEKAIKNNKKKRKKTIKGGSTISQQTAKNVFLWQGRTWLRKGLEVYFTLLIETFWSKERILEVYLNVIEMGNGIYGVEAASETYFHKHASNLNAGECAAIAAILPNPRKWSPKKPNGYISRRKSWILRNMRNIEILEFEEESTKE
ncbi:MAG: monofunctional biosynthetic peptidoglycan transglycosylase [Bacteroidia bacterium]|nr:monofunctional biosynthetic peptidoglycan transglycosylase [Bacteroidia bacterium]